MKKKGWANGKCHGIGFTYLFPATSVLKYGGERWEYGLVEEE
jgi:hypothetical protein